MEYSFFLPEYSAARPTRSSCSVKPPLLSPCPVALVPDVPACLLLLVKNIDDSVVLRTVLAAVSMVEANFRARGEGGSPALLRRTGVPLGCPQST